MSGSNQELILYFNRFKNTAMNVVWTEIPTLNLERAIAFYSAVFELEMKVNFTSTPRMSFLPFDSNSPGSPATLIEMPDYYTPSNTKGALVYFACADIDNVETRIVENGGKILIGKKHISPEQGYMAVFEDTEGNRIALHSN